VFEEICKKGLPRDVVAYNTILHGLCKNEMIDKTLCLFYEMKKMERKPNAISYDILICYLFVKNDNKKAMELLKEMKVKRF
jgi:pentatricopeptide repeat protein